MNSGDFASRKCRLSNVMHCDMPGWFVWNGTRLSQHFWASYIVFDNFSLLELLLRELKLNLFFSEANKGLAISVCVHVPVSLTLALQFHCSAGHCVPLHCCVLLCMLAWLNVLSYVKLLYGTIWLQ